MRTLDRYVLRHIQVPFVSALALVVVLVFLLHSRRLAESVLGLGLNGEDVLIVFLAALPPFLVIVIPLAYMASVMIGLGRLAGDLELVACGAAGASPWRLARVPLLLGAVVSALTTPIAHFAAPYGMARLYDRILDIGVRNLSQAIQPGTFSEGLGGMAIYAEGRAADGRLSNVLIFDSQDSDHPVLAVALGGELTPSGRGLVLDLSKGELHLARGAPGAASTSTSTATALYDRVRFQKAALGIDIEEQLGQHTQFLSQSQRMASADMVAAFHRIGRQDLWARRAERDYWRRYAHPLMAVIFGLLGAALTLSGGRRRARNVLWALGAIVAYYLLGRVGDYLVTQNIGPPWAAVFGADGIMLGAGLIAMRRAGRPR